MKAFKSTGRRTASSSPFAARIRIRLRPLSCRRTRTRDSTPTGMSAHPQGRAISPSGFVTSFPVTACFASTCANATCGPYWRLRTLQRVGRAQRPRPDSASQGNRRPEFDDCLVVRSPDTATVLDWQDRVGSLSPPDGTEETHVGTTILPAANGKAAAAFYRPLPPQHFPLSFNVVEFAADGTVSHGAVPRDRRSQSRGTIGLWCHSELRS